MKKQQSVKEPHMKASSEGSNKKIYSMPKLVVLGKVEELTATVEVGTECDAIFPQNSTGFPCPS